MLENIFRRSTYPSLGWEHKFQSTVWRLMPSHPSFIVGECRDVNLKNTTFFCVDIFTGRIQWTNLHLEERWWVGIESVVNKFIVFHKYLRPDMPQHQGIIIVDLISGVTVWSNDHYKYYGIDDNCIYVQDEALIENQLLKLDIKTGKVIEEITYEAFNHKPATQSPTSYITADIINLEEISIPVVKKYLSNKKGDKLIDPTEILVSGNLYVIGINYKSSQQPQQGSVSEDILIMNKGGKVLYQECINTGGSVPVLTKFFLKQNIIIYIKDKNRLKAIKITADNENIN